jgi:hypothetical protein
VKDKRLPPQPTDTALARAVRRWVDRLPNTSIGKRRELDAKIQKQAVQISDLRILNQTKAEHVVHLRKDISKLVERHAIHSPSFERLHAALEHCDMSRDYVLRVGVKYEDQWVALTIPAHRTTPRDLSEIGLRAVKDAAYRISQRTAEEQAKHIEHAVLRKGIFEQRRAR